MWKWSIDKEEKIVQNSKRALEQCLDITILKQDYLDIGCTDWNDWCFRIVEKDVKI